MKRFLLCVVLWSVACPASAQLVISGNENKIDLSGGKPLVVPNAKPDSLTLLDFKQFPPTVRHLRGISNSVIGPPSNIAITPDGRLALIADSLKVDPRNPTETIPANRIHILDLTTNLPEVIGTVTVGKQPSGMSITADGTLALVANRAEGTVSVLSISGKRVKLVQTATVCEPDEEASDVAITPDGRRALVSITKGGFLRPLRIDGMKVLAIERKLSVYGGPYRTLITPDGQLGLTAGGGLGGAPDTDAISVIDLSANPIRTIDYIAIGAGPESIELSPDGKLLAAVLMNGSNLPADDPLRTEKGLLVLLSRQGKTFVKRQEISVGRIPEGVAFTSDGRYLIVQCHPSRQLWVFSVEGNRVNETAHRIDVPGFPSSLRAAQ